ncbi:MAG: glycosyltransferase family 4 protein [Candidatus Cryptobacteroides sp.]|jgi:teichuronic acid biosynthesis glycosyltransferase TuaC
MSTRTYIKSLTVIAGDYPAEGHIVLVFVQQLVHAIMDLGIKVTVIAPQSVVHAIFRRQKFLPRRSIASTQKGTKYEIYRPYIFTFGNNKRLNSFWKKFNNFQVSSVLKKLYNEVIYAHFWSSAQFVSHFAIEKKIPLFVAYGESGDAQEKMASSLNSAQLKELSSSVSGVISVSSENKRKCIKYKLANEELIGVFPNCVDTMIFYKKDEKELRKKLGILPDDFVVIFVGAFIPRKGPNRLAEAITKINDPHLKVIFVGKVFSGYPFDFNCPGIVYKGALDHEILPKFLNAADVFVLPTRNEGCCNAIVEALAVGLPIISSDGAFNDDILDDQNSIRVDPDDVDAIADAIVRLRDNAALRKQMSEITVSRHESYSIEGRAKRIIDFMNRIIGNNLS